MHLTRWLPALAALAVLCLRALQVRSSGALLYHGEFAGIARLGWELQTGTFAWNGMADFIQGHSYQAFAQGTTALQVVAAALSPVLGHTLWAQWGAAAVFEAAGVATAVWLGCRQGALQGGGLAAALVFAPAMVAAQQMMPFGNHCEFLWVPFGLALCLRGEKLVAAGALMVAGVFLYRFNLVPCGVFVVVLLLERRWRVLGVPAAAALVLAGLFTWLGLTPWGTSPDPAPMPSLLPAMDALWANAQSGWEDFGSLRIGWPHRALLLVAVPFAWRQGRVGRFLALWAAAAVLIPIVAGRTLPRYLVPAFYACTACVALSHRRAGWVLLALGALGLFENADFVARDKVDMGPLGLWFEQEVDAVDADELPFYRDAPASPWVGWSSHRSACPARLGTRFRDPVDPGADHCDGWPEGALTDAFAALPEDADLQAVRLGIWIRSNRDDGRARAATD
jgi:hypothetical protein